MLRFYLGMVNAHCTSNEIVNQAQYGLGDEFLSSVWAFEFYTSQTQRKLVTTENMKGTFKKLVIDDNNVVLVPKIFLGSFS